MNNTRINVHLGTGERPTFYQPSDFVPLGAVKMGDATIFPPHGRDEAVEFYRMLIKVASEAVCALGADEDCIRG
jgi:hypothetical protein